MSVNLLMVNEHKDGIVQSTKEEADKRHHDEEWDGKTTEKAAG